MFDILKSFYFDVVFWLASDTHGLHATLGNFRWQPEAIVCQSSIIMASAITTIIKLNLKPVIQRSNANLSKRTAYDFTFNLDALT